MINLPKQFKSEMQELLLDDYRLFLNSYSLPRFAGLRINTLKTSVEEFQSLSSNELKNLNLKNIPWCINGYYYLDSERPAKIPYYNAGIYYIQEPSAMSPVEYLDIRPEMKVLDLCSAPGGKTTQIAGKLNRSGFLVTNDISAQRIKAVLRNVEMHGISNALITNDSPTKLSAKFESYFDRILLDVPCSGEGMFRKDPDLIKTYSQSRAENPDMQKQILLEAAKMIKPGGLIMYSTCTFNLEENELQIREFLKKNSDFEIVNIDKSFGFIEGFGMPEAARLFPHKLSGEGHFICLLKCNKILKEHCKQKETHMRYTPKSLLPKEYLDFEKTEMNIEIDGNFVVENNKIYMELDTGIDLKGIKIVRNGLFIGEIKGKNFNPSPAFIMAMKKENFKNTLSFNVDDENLLKYLKCETIFADHKDGFVVICVDDFTLGYGKIKDGKLKNYYNKNWRIL